MKYIVDRFEGIMAVCEDENKNIVSIPKYKLPLEVMEGDCLKEKDGFIVIDEVDTNKRRENMKKKMDNLFE